MTDTCRDIDGRTFFGVIIADLLDLPKEAHLSVFIFSNINPKTAHTNITMMMIDKNENLDDDFDFRSK